MEKLSTFLTLYALGFAIVIPMARSSFDKHPSAVLSWFENIPNKKEKTVQLQFYVHHVVDGEHPTSYTVNAPDISITTPTRFGLTRMVDDPIRVGPEPDSHRIGRVQGSASEASLEESSILTSLSYLFTEGEYNCTTFSVLARDPYIDEYREMPILGGTGVFRNARGILTARSISLNMTTGNAVTEMIATVLYYA